MSNVIEFLEKLGSDAQLLQAAKEEVALALADAKVGASEGEAILARDAQALHELLKIVPMVCFQTTPEEEEEEKEGDEDEEGDEKAKKPSKSASESSATARAADLA
ncbi:hypothetical protein [Dyella sp. C11]|uniref:hypothetical protein n=1 Tax=Dyella sp. C11 TaxID=2126991 RepID=UPI000D64ED1C|nr:hypothetical protein [Dyella sp. C11]